MTPCYYFTLRKKILLSPRPTYVKSLQDPEVIGAPNLQLTLQPHCYRRQELKNFNVEVASTGIVLHEVS
jgi:hypothetical protein